MSVVKDVEIMHQGVIFRFKIKLTITPPPPPEIEVKDAPGDSYHTIQKLAPGGICAIDDNLKRMEEDLGIDFSQALEDKLKLESIRALNDTVTFLNSNNKPGDPIAVLGNPEHC
jgi:hypothetical protein